MSPSEILPALNQPVRTYPLRAVNEPSVYIAGDKMGQKVYPPGPGAVHGVPSSIPPMQPPGVMPMNFSQQQAMVAQQNSNMEMLERRREQERARNRSGSTGAVSPCLTFSLFCVDTFKATAPDRR